MNKIRFKQFYVQKNFKERFIKPMVYWSEFFKVGLYDSEKFRVIEGIVEYDVSMMNNHKIIFEAKDIFDVTTYKAIFIDERSNVSKIKSDEINPRKAYQYSIILNSQDGTIDIPTATNADAELVFTFIQEKISKLKTNKLNNESLLKSKLDEIKLLFENNVLTEEEYNIKRKQIIEKY